MNFGADRELKDQTVAFMNLKKQNDKIIDC